MQKKLDSLQFYKQSIRLSPATSLKLAFLLHVYRKYVLEFLFNLIQVFSLIRNYGLHQLFGHEN